MLKVWKIVAIIVVVVAVIGLIISGTGLITGASPDRIVRLAFGGWDGLRHTLDAYRPMLYFMQ